MESEHWTKATSDTREHSTGRVSEGPPCLWTSEASVSKGKSGK